MTVNPRKCKSQSQAIATRRKRARLLQPEIDRRFTRPELDRTRRLLRPRDALRGTSLKRHPLRLPDACGNGESDFPLRPLRLPNGPNAPLRGVLTFILIDEAIGGIIANRPRKTIT